LPTHLKIAGRPDQLFTEDALTLIHTTSRGYPRAVNNLSLQALVAAFVTGKNLVDEAAARASVSEVVGD
jgi:type II secretory pathway predicted ATPase ExeA